MQAETPEERSQDDSVNQAAVWYWRTRICLAYARFVIWVLWVPLGAGDAPPADPFM